MDLSQATEAEKVVEPEVRQLVCGSAPPRPAKINRRPKFYTSVTIEEFPKLVEYVRDEIARRFDLNDSVPDSVAWWIIERMLRRAPDCPAVTSSIEERRLIAAKHLMALGDDYSDEFTVLGRNGKAEYSIGALRSVSRSAPRQQKGIPDGASSYGGSFEETKTLRMSLAACIVSDSTDQSTLAWGKPETRELALTVTMLLAQFINEEITREELDAFLREEPTDALSSPTLVVSADDRSFTPTESTAVTEIAGTDHILLADMVVSARIDYDAHPELFEDLEALVHDDEVAALVVAAGLHSPGSPSFEDTLRALRESLDQGVSAADRTSQARPVEAAVSWLFSLLPEDERLLLQAFAYLPDGFVYSLELLTGEEGLGHPLTSLTRLSAEMYLILETTPERYRLLPGLHGTMELVVQRLGRGDSLPDVFAAVVDYYESRLWNVVRTLELERLASSATLRIAAGYDAQARPPLAVAEATEWWELEKTNILRLHASLAARSRLTDVSPAGEPGRADLDALSLMLRVGRPADRILSAVNASSPSDLVARIQKQHTEVRFLNMSARREIQRSNELMERGIREAQAELALEPNKERAEELENMIQRLRR